MNDEQEVLIGMLLDKHRINAIDGRGFYIVLSGLPSTSGIYYLHKDGTIYKGIQKNIPAFWETMLEASNFFNEWRKEQAECLKYNRELNEEELK